MSSKFLSLLSLLIISSCGVKGPPIAPAGTEVPSFVSPYLKDKKQVSKKEKKAESEQSKVDK